MSQARPRSINLFCEFGFTRQQQPRLRRAGDPRNVSTSTSRPAGQAGLSQHQDDGDNTTITEIALSGEQLRNQLLLKSSADVWRRAFFGSKTVMRGRAINSRFMLFQDRLQSRGLEDYEEERHGRRIRRRYEGRETPKDRETRHKAGEAGEEGEEGDRVFEDSEIPKFVRLHDIGKRQSPAKVTVQLVRHQLRSCTSPEDFTRVFSVLLDTRPGMPSADGKGAKTLANETTQRIIAHSLARYDARRALVSLSLLIRRLEEHKQVVDNSIIRLALITSAQSHSFVALRHYMSMSASRQYEDNIGGSLLYRLSEQIVEGLRIGFQNNPGRPVTVDALQTILYADPNTATRQEDLRQYLPRQYDAFAKWVYLLAECKAVERLKHEWMDTQDRFDGENSRPDNEIMEAQWKSRSPRLFVHAFFRAGSPQDAWTVFAKHGSNIAKDDDEIWDQLMENIEHKPELPEPLQQILESMLAERLDKMLKNIEKNMGIAWTPGKDGQAGHHDVSKPNTESVAEVDEDQDVLQDGLEDVKAFTQFAIERKEEILAQKDDILAGRDPRPYKGPFS